MKKITLEACLQTYSIEQALIINLNKIAYDKAKGFAQGSDQKTFWESFTRPLKQLHDIKKEINHYQFEPSRLKIRRIKNKTRKLYISTWKDKIVETFLSKSLNKLLSNWFSTKSYAYRIDRIDINTCQKHIVDTLKSSRYFLKIDIKDFFYTLDQDILLDKLKDVIDESDPLYAILKQRILFKYSQDDEVKDSELGIPFGSPLACTFSNVYMTELDRKMEELDVHYFRYADDIIITHNLSENVLKARDVLFIVLDKLKLEINTRKFKQQSFDDAEGFEKINRISHLGLEYTANGLTRVPIEKRRKIMNMFKRAILAKHSQIKKCKSIDEKVAMCAETINYICKKRIRNAAIIDYYLKHTTDDQQLIDMDREIVEFMIGVILDKRFRKKDYKKVPFKLFRQHNLISLVHRSRRLRSRADTSGFLSLFNTIIFERHITMLDKRKNMIDNMRARKQFKKESKAKV